LPGREVVALWNLVAPALLLVLLIWYFLCRYLHRGVDHASSSSEVGQQSRFADPEAFAEDVGVSEGTVVDVSISRAG
jgi:hypothetical protein